MFASTGDGEVGCVFILTLTSDGHTTQRGVYGWIRCIAAKSGNQVGAARFCSMMVQAGKRRVAVVQSGAWLANIDWIAPMCCKACS